MPGNVQPALRHQIYGEGVAQGCGVAAGLVLGTSVAIDVLAASAGVEAPSELLAKHLGPAARALSATVGPACAAGRWAAARAAQAHPALGLAVYGPDKFADWAAAALGSWLDGVPLRHQQALALRLPGAPYPVACDWGEADAACPDPLGYLRSAQFSPYFYALTAGVAGCALGGWLMPKLWRVAAPSLSLVPLEIAQAAAPSWAAVPLRQVVRGAGRAAQELAALQAVANAAPAAGRAAVAQGEAAAEPGAEAQGRRGAGIAVPAEPAGGQERPPEGEGVAP